MKSKRLVTWFDLSKSYFEYFIHLLRPIVPVSFTKNLTGGTDLLDFCSVMSYHI